jgi:predicted outer membrane repeat protein
MRPVLTVTALLIGMTAAPAIGAVRYVAPHGIDGTDCTNPSMPCRTVGHALAQVGVDVINIAEGTYEESLAVAASATKTLAGGWSADFSTRDVSKLDTILTGTTDRALTLDAGAGDTISFTLDGLTIAKSVATSTIALMFLSGGGLAAGASAGGDVVLNLSGVTMSKNRANGGGALALGATGTGSTISALIQDCRFEANRADGLGGGAIRTNQVGSSSLGLIVADTMFKGNRDKRSAGGAVVTNVGGGITDTHAYRRTTFLKNSTGGSGGAIAVDVFPGVFTLQIDNSVFLTNKAGGNGGAVNLLSHSNPAAPAGSLILQVRHATFVGNKAKGGGGALNGRAFSDSDVTLNASVANSILWGNQAGGTGQDVALAEDSGGSLTATFTRNDIADLSAGPGVSVTQTGGLDVDPAIIKKNGHLKPGSPMIDAAACIGVVDDIDGDARPLVSLCDIGADEVAP